jgi:hypothetical protein
LARPVGRRSIRSRRPPPRGNTLASAASFPPGAPPMQTDGDCAKRMVRRSVAYSPWNTGATRRARTCRAPAPPAPPLAAINDAGAEQLCPPSQQGGHVLRSTIATAGSAVVKFTLRQRYSLPFTHLDPVTDLDPDRFAAATIADRGAGPVRALRCGDTCGKNDMIDNKNVQSRWMIGKFNLVSEVNLREAFGDKDSPTNSISDPTRCTTRCGA